ncbi:hypothetical protein BGX31_004277, partial [Mortierella sp. GBA43]
IDEDTAENDDDSSDLSSMNLDPPGDMKAWTDLHMAAIALHAGKQVDIPLEPEVANLSPAKANLLRMATSKLVLFKYNPDRGTALREAYVALSCTVDLSCGGIRCYMGNDYVTSAAHAFTWTLDNIWRRSITEPLVDILKHRRVKRLRGHVSKRKGEIDEQEEQETPELQKEYNILCVVEQLGEAVAHATKTPRLDMKEFGRKVDLLFYEGNIELGNLEFKKEKIRNNEMRNQH